MWVSKTKMDSIERRLKWLEERREAECVAGTRQRCSCGAPSLFVHEEHGPLCAPCGYHYAN